MRKRKKSVDHRFEFNQVMSMTIWQNYPGWKEGPQEPFEMTEATVRKHLTQRPEDPIPLGLYAVYLKEWIDTINNGLESGVSWLDLPWDLEDVLEAQEALDEG